MYALVLHSCFMSRLGLLNLQLKPSSVFSIILFSCFGEVFFTGAAAAALAAAAVARFAAAFSRPDLSNMSSLDNA